MKFLNVLVVLLSGILILSCTSDEKMKQQVSKMLQDDPKILTEAIEKHPAAFIEALQKAAKNAQEEMGKNREAEEKKKLEDSFEHPLMANIRNDEAIRGPKEAPLRSCKNARSKKSFCFS